MKQVNVSKTSWHYKLAKFGSSTSYVPDNLCPYLRKVMLGGFFGAVIAFLSFIVAFSYTNALAWLVAVLLHGYVPIDPIASIAGGLTLLMACGAAAFGFHVMKQVIREKYPAARDKPERVTFIGLLYRKFKDKTCVELNFNRE